MKTSILKNRFLILKNLQRRAKTTSRLLPCTFKPVQILIDITDRCNYRCPTCTKWLQTSDSGELSAQQWKTFLEQSVSLTFTRRIVFAGGEPFLRPDLIELVSFAAQRNFSTVVISNGSLISMRELDDLQKAGLDYLMISLNSLNAEVHDESRGVPGSCDHIVRLLRSHSMSENNLSVGIAAIIMQSNLEQIPQLVDFVTKHKLHGILFQAYVDNAVHHPFKNGFEAFRTAEWYKTDKNTIRDFDQLDRIIDQLLDSQERGAPILNPSSQLCDMKSFYRNPATYSDIPCTAGITSFLVDAYGDVRFCYGSATLGNILDQKPAALWKTPAAQQLRKQIRNCVRSCRIMNHIY